MPEPSLLLLALVALLLLVLVAVFVAYEKLSRQTVAIRRELILQTDNCVTQIECLLALYHELQPQSGLPRTRGWAASPDFLLALATAVDRQRPRVVVECSSGLSTVVLASKLRQIGVGHVFSLEHLPEYAQKTRELLAKYGLEEWATVLDAPLVDLNLPGWEGQWYRRDALGDLDGIDLVVVDGPPHDTGPLARYPALPALRDRLAARAVLILDDAGREAERRIVERWLQDNPAIRLGAAPKCEKGCVVLET